MSGAEGLGKRPAGARMSEPLRELLSMRSTQRGHETSTPVEQPSPANENPVPDDLESPRTKLVYLYLRERGDGSVEQLRTALDMKSITLYPVLGTLVEKEHVQLDGNRYVCR